MLTRLIWRGSDSFIVSSAANRVQRITEVSLSFFFWSHEGEVVLGILMRWCLGGRSPCWGARSSHSLRAGELDARGVES